MHVLYDWALLGHRVEAGLATCDDEVRACQVLRHRVYCEEMAYLPTDPRGIETDDVDRWSTIFCVRFDGHITGTMRLIDCARGCQLTGGTTGKPARFSGRPFDLPRVHPITGEHLSADSLVEGSRFVARRLDLGEGLTAVQSSMLLRAGMRWCRDNGKRAVVGALRAGHLERLRDAGWQALEFMARRDGAPHTFYQRPYRLVLLPTDQDPDEPQVFALRHPATRREVIQRDVCQTDRRA